MWTLDDGVKLVRLIQEESMRMGFHVTIGGSVLTNGESTRDLDLFLFPLSHGEEEDLSGLIKWFKELWGDPSDDCAYAPRDTEVQSIFDELSRVSAAIDNPRVPFPGPRRAVSYRINPNWSHPGPPVD